MRYSGVPQEMISVTVGIWAYYLHPMFSHTHWMQLVLSKICTLTVWRPFYLLLVKPRLPCASYSKCPSSTSCFHRLCVSHTFWKCCRLSALLWGWFLVCIFKIRWAVKPASFFSAVALRESVYPKALWWSVSRAEAKKHSREFVTALHCYVNAIPDSITCSSLKLLPLKLKVLPLISRTN